MASTTLHHITTSNEKKRGPGRPKVAPEDKRRAVSVQLSDVERALVEAAARRDGETWAAWARRALLTAAARR